jgi:hypothetical protein
MQHPLALTLLTLNPLKSILVTTIVLMNENLPPTLVLVEAVMGT